MTNPHKRLDRLQEQMQREWDRIEEESCKAIKAMLRDRYRDLEAREAELLAEIKSLRGTLEKQR